MKPKIISEPDDSGLGEEAGLKISLDTVPPSTTPQILIGNFWSKGKREPVYVEPEDIDALIEYLEKAKKEVKA